MTFRRSALALAALFAAAAPAGAQQRIAQGLEEDEKTEAVRNTAPANPRVYREAQAFRGTRIMVSTNERRLLLMAGTDTLMDVAVAVGMGKDFEYQGRKFRFETPTGRRRVLAKSPNPVWTVPEWHYMEKAAARDLELVRLQADDKVELSDGSFILVKGDQVGRVNQNGHFWAFTPGLEIVFDDKIFMPPITTQQRRVPDALGPYKLDLGDGYLIHGTHIYNEESVGDAVSHGCVRMTNADLDRLYFMVEAGVPVFIY